MHPETHFCTIATMDILASAMLNESCLLLRSCLCMINFAMLYCLFKHKASKNGWYLAQSSVLAKQAYFLQHMFFAGSRCLLCHLASSTCLLYSAIWYWLPSAQYIAILSACMQLAHCYLHRLATNQYDPIETL